MKIVTFIEQLSFWAVNTPNAIAMVAPDRDDASFSYFYETVIKTRTIFDKVGIQPRARAGILISNPTEYAVASFAISSGAISVPISPYISPSEAGRLFKLLKLENLVTDLSPDSPVIVATLKAGVTPVFIASQPDKPCGTFRVLNEPVSESCRWGFNSLDDISLILQTSGSTANPKLVPLQERALITDLIPDKKRNLNLTINDRCLNFMPLNHLSGLHAGIYAPLYAGGSSALTGVYNKSLFFQWLKQLRPTWFATSPAHFKDIIKGYDEETIACELKNTFLRFIVTGAAPITNQFGLRLEKTLGVPLIQGYGMTETLGIAVNTNDYPKIGSVGKAMGMEIGIFDQDNQNCAPYKTGLIKVKGETVFKGYLDNDEANKAAFDNGWFITGDMGWLDEDGYLYLTGRLKETINKGGEKISPEEVETWLTNYPAIEEAVVFGISHPVLGEEVAAAIVLHPDQKTIDISDLKMYLSKELFEFKIPVHILVTGKLPKSENGKIMRREAISLFYPQISIIHHNSSSNSPCTPVEQYVFGWFNKILNTSDIGIDEEFTSLGGTSFNVAELLSGMEAELGEIIPVVTFMRASSVAKFSKVLESKYNLAINKILQTKDPVFFEHKDIDKKKMEAGYSCDSSPGDPIQLLATELGYLSKKEDTENTVRESREEISFEDILIAQKKFFSSWQGVKRNDDSLIAGFNVQMYKIPLFWCFQGFEEFQRMSQIIDRPLYGMRSGNLLSINPADIKNLAKCYANEIEDLYKTGPIISGGNCQGAFVAWEISRELKSRGREIALICLMEANISESYEGNVSMFYGMDSPFNPLLSKEDSIAAFTKMIGNYPVDYRKKGSRKSLTEFYGKNSPDYNPLICKNPHAEWKKLYKKYTVDIIKGGHGEYFTDQNISDFVLKLKKRCDDGSKCSRTIK